MLNSTGETDQGDKDFINKLVEKENELIFNELDFVITK
jgi:hypothetical protein